MKSASKRHTKKENGFVSGETFGITLILFSVISAILMLLSDVLFGRQWFYTQFLYGVFGYFAFAVFAVLCYFGVILLIGKRRAGGNGKKSALVALFLFLLVCLIHSLTAADAGDGYGAYINDCYLRGENGLDTCTGGGALLALIIYPAVKFLTPVGCYVLFPVLMIVDVAVFVRISITKATEKKKKNNKPKEFAGYKMYPDDSFDFKTAPAVKSGARLYDRAENDTAPRSAKKTDRTERDRALTILYPDKQSKSSFAPADTNAKNSLNRTENFTGRSYQRQMDRDYERSSGMVRRPGATDGNDRSQINDFSNRASVSERRTFDADLSQRRRGEEFQNGDSSVEQRRVNLFDGRRNAEPAEDDAIFLRGSDRRELEKERNARESFERASEKTDDTAAVRSRSIFDKARRRSGSGEDNIKNDDTADDVEIIDTLTRESRDRSPFAEKWDKRFRTLPEVKKEEPAAKPEPIVTEKPAEAKAEESKPVEENKTSNVKKFDLQTEKRAIYVEPDTGDAVMPEDEQPQNNKDDGEQLQLVENKEYIGIPEMPIRYKYNKPPIDLYKDNPKKLVSEDENVEKRISIIEKTLESFNIPAKVENIVSGPTLTRYELSMPEGISVKKVPPYASDLAMNLEVEAVRIDAPIPGKSLVGIEVPNKVKEMVGMKELLLEKDYQKSPPEALSIVLGEDVVGNPVITDLAKTPHLLVAGATGMGKSVFLNSMIMSLVTKYGPEDLRLVLVDPKQVEFSIYEHMPHLLIDQIITEAQLCIGILDWAIDEMEMRYKIFRSFYAQKIDEYNSSINPKTQRKMPKIVIIIDELGDLFSISSQIKHDIEDRIRRLTQKARAAGIHVVVATQRPDVTVITGVIKTNLPSRIAFKVINYVDSKTIIDDGGAEKLLGNGDMIFKTSNSALLRRIQGAYVSKGEMVSVLNYIKEHNDCFYDSNAKKYLDAKKASTQNGGTAASISFGDNADNENDPSTFNNIPIRNLRALKVVIEKKQASISLLQRSLSIGYSTAGRIIDWMEKMGYISPFEGAKAREVLITMDEFENLYGEAELD
ncbi:MAG: hypothetical protein IJR61_02140 [Clostridia bacterium]|nr:hypothetical protein [Clostridia bacterium]